MKKQLIFTTNPVLGYILGSGDVERKTEKNPVKTNTSKKIGKDVYQFVS
jgi:hypothetical protein